MEVHTRVTMYVFKPTGFSVTVFVRTKDRWLAIMTALQYCLHPGEERCINDIYATYRAPKEGEVVLEPLDETNMAIYRPLGRNRLDGGSVSVSGSDGARA